MDASVPIDNQERFDRLASLSAELERELVQLKQEANRLRKEASAIIDKAHTSHALHHILEL